MDVLIEVVVKVISRGFPKYRRDMRDNQYQFHLILTDNEGNPILKNGIELKVMMHIPDKNHRFNKIKIGDTLKLKSWKYKGAYISRNGWVDSSELEIDIVETGKQ